MSKKINIKKLLKQLTVDEKIAQLTAVLSFQLMEKGDFSEEKAAILLKDGIGHVAEPAGITGLSGKALGEFINRIQKFLIEGTRTGIPAILHEGCLSGYICRGATMFPQIIGVAATWDESLVKRMAAAIREQLKPFKIAQVLDPVLDIARDARWGRMEETFGEDPFLAGVLGTEYVRGIQEGDAIVATLKHFAGYGASRAGQNWGPAAITKRELYDYFLLPFEMAVKYGKAGSVMNGYHEIDGVPCGANGELMRDLLKDNWGFEGTVVSDYHAVDMLGEYHRIAENEAESSKLAIEAGMDVELPYLKCFKNALLGLVERGELDMALINDSVERVLRIKEKTGLFRNPYVAIDALPMILDNESSRKLAHEIAVKSIILLKNANQTLPLKKDIRSIAVIGPHIDSERLLLGDYSFKAHMEALVNANADQNFAGPQPDFTHISMDTVKTVTLLEGISSHVSDRTALYCETGCDVNSEDESRFEKAVSVASKADHVILALGDQSGMTRACTCGEARDSMTLELPGVQKKLMEKILETGKPVTLIMISGRPYSLLDFEERLDAIIQAWLPGEEGGAAVADILFGGANPGGKLPVTYPAHVGQLPVYYNHKPSGQQSKWFIDYVDGPAKPLYPFGHGLSYTRFTYSDLEISREWAMTDPFIDFSFNIKNTGTRDGDEIVQLYIHDVKGSVTRPVKELKGFKRVHLRKDETRRIKAQLPVNTLAFVDKTDQKCVEPGVFRVMIGSSSEDIRLTADIHLTGEKRYDVTSMPSKDLYHILI